MMRINAAAAAAANDDEEDAHDDGDGMRAFSGQKRQKTLSFSLFSIFLNALVTGGIPWFELGWNVHASFAVAAVNGVIWLLFRSR